MDKLLHEQMISTEFEAGTYETLWEEFADCQSNNKPCYTQVNY